MPCKRCGGSVDGADGLCKVCLRAVRVEVINNDIDSLEVLLMELAVLKGVVQKCRYDYGRLDDRTTNFLNAVFDYAGLALANVHAEIDDLRRKKEKLERSS